MGAANPDETRLIRVWDLPTRISHWVMVGLVGFSWWSAEAGAMNWHRSSGYTLLGVVLFRLYWGFAGAASARFRNFVRAPRTVLTYARAAARGSATPSAGHNPLGGWSVLALLSALSLQVVTGLFATDMEGFESGPLSYLVTFELSRLSARLHAVSFNVLLFLIALHIVAVIFYLLFRGENLIASMFTGIKRTTANLSFEINFVRPWRVWAGIACVLAFTYFVTQGLKFH